MFQPPVFREERREVMYDLMRAHPFATLVSSALGHLSADHVPLVLYADGQQKAVLHGHIAVANPLFRETEGPIEIMAIFQGPQSYITPSWYRSKKEHGKVVPTWNYVVVHARGTLRFIRETDWLLAHLNDLTNQHESHRETPWTVSDAPIDFISRQLKGLVGFEIEVGDLAGTWKVSQNKNAADNTGVQAGLRSEGDPEKVSVSHLVQERGRTQ